MSRSKKINISNLKKKIVYSNRNLQKITIYWEKGKENIILIEILVDGRTNKKRCYLFNN